MSTDGDRHCHRDIENEIEKDRGEDDKDYLFNALRRAGIPPHEIPPHDLSKRVYAEGKVQYFFRVPSLRKAQFRSVVEVKEAIQKNRRRNEDPSSSRVYARPEREDARGLASARRRRDLSGQQRSGLGKLCFRRRAHGTVSTRRTRHRVAQLRDGTSFSSREGTGGRGEHASHHRRERRRSDLEEQPEPQRRHADELDRCASSREFTRVQCRAHERHALRRQPLLEGTHERRACALLGGGSWFTSRERIYDGPGHDARGHGRPEGPHKADGVRSAFARLYTTSRRVRVRRS